MNKIVETISRMEYTYTELKVDCDLLISALISCSDRLRIMRDNGRAKMLDNLSIDQADAALAKVGIYKNK